MKHDKIRQYLDTPVDKETPKEQLLLMFYEGAIRFCEQAKDAINNRDLSGSYHPLVKAKQIMAELIKSLDEQTAHKPLYDNLSSIYNFVYIRIVEANIKKDVALIDDAVKILQTLRDAWAEAIDKKEPK